MGGRRKKLKDPDSYVLGLVASKPNLLIPPHFLMHSYLYYVEDSPIITDATFDTLVKRLEENWEDLEHQHKALIDKELLKTGFYLEYPTITISAARRLGELFKQ